MSITLNSADLMGVQRLAQTLLSPLRYPHLDEWRRSVCQEAKELLGADLATFQMPAPGATLFFSDEIPQEIIGAYPELAQLLDRRFQMWKRKVALGVCNRPMLWAPHLDEYERDPYYQDVVVPARCFDALMVASALDPYRIAPGTVATLMLHHVRPDGTRFGERGLAVLRLLQPAFQAGVHSYRRLADCQAGMGRLLDTMSDGTVLIDADGRVVHENTAFGRMLADEMETVRVQIRGAIEVLARAFRRTMQTIACNVDELPVASLVREVRTSRSVYRLHGTVVDETLVGRTSGALITVERVASSTRSESASESPILERLRQRLGLTAREAEVALLLAAGHGNKEVAEKLTISPHTARRHTEQVLYKLGVRSRAAVAQHLWAM